MKMELQKNNMLLESGELGKISKDNFEKWFVGFSEGEACFPSFLKYLNLF